MTNWQAEHLMLQSTPSPSRGGIKGGGTFGPNPHGGSEHPHPTSPVKGEEPISGIGQIAHTHRNLPKAA
jgi:hypothetical protein